MTFLHKLARRLARLKDRTPIAVAAASLAAAIVGCEQPSVSTQPITPTVSQLIISPKAVTVQPGQLQDFMAVGLLSTGDTAQQLDVTWSTSGGSVSATSTHGGRHYGQYKSGSCGSYQVTATAHPGNKFDVASVNVACPGTVASVAVSPAAATVLAGQTLQLTATPKDSAGNPLSGWAMTWASSNPAVTTVDSSGLTSGVAPGSATITAVSGGQSGTSTITVTTTSVSVASVTVSPATPSVTVGQTVQLSATMKDANSNTLTGRTATWVSSNTNVATVTGSGLVTGVTAGTATITATSEGKNGTATVTVSNVPVASVTVSPAASTVTVGQTLQLSATMKDASNNTLTGRTATWVTSSPAVATVSASGLVTAVAAGTATITATSEGKSGTAAITVQAPVVANPGTVSNLAVPGTTDTSVTLSFTEVSDGTGQPASYDIRYAAGTISWSAASSVTRGTCATPVAGTVVGAKRACTVLGLAAGTGYQFQLVAFRGTLNQNAVFGALSNVASGTTSASTAPVASVTVSPAAASVTVGQTALLTALLKDASGNVLTGRTVSWASSSSSVATVSGGGLVSGVAVGTATVTATSEGKSGTAAVTVSSAGGGTVLIQENFQDAALAGRGWYDDAAAVTTTQHLPGATGALEAHFLKGATTATWGGGTRHQFTPTPTLYLSYWVKYSDNWVGSGSIDHPHEFYLLSNLDGQYAALANDWLTTYVETNFVNGAGTPRVSLQDNLAINRNMGTTPNNLIGVTENRSVGGCNGISERNLWWECYGSGTYNDKQFNRGGTVAFQAQSGTGYKGNWNHVEAYFQMNSVVNGIGQADGIVQYWFNGTPIIDRHDVMFRTGARATLTFGQLVIGPYIGSGSPVDQYMWVDNLTVATQHP